MERRFLLWLLAGIFTYQAAIFTVGVIYCAKTGGLKSCPEIGMRYDQTFSVALATVLALLTGTAVPKK